MHPPEGNRSAGDSRASTSEPDGNIRIGAGRSLSHRTRRAAGDKITGEGDKFPRKKTPNHHLETVGASN
jgi:hypothetical protein